MIGYFTRHPVAANLLMILICFLGLSVINQMKRETFPAFTPSSVSVSVGYPGASARDVDENVCGPLEDALTGISGLVQLDCLSMEGRASATAELAEGGDLTKFYNDIFSTVSGIGDFPTEVENPTVTALERTEFIANLAVSGIASRDGLIDYANDLSDRILRVNGVATASVSGLSDSEIRIEYDEAALRLFGLSAEDVVNRVNSRSLSQPLGSAHLSEGALTLRYSDTRRSVRELQDMIVLQNLDGAIVRLGDLAKIHLAEADENISSFIDGSPAAILSISKTAEADAIRVFAAVEELLNKERATYLEPFALTITSNSTAEVEVRINLIMQNIALGLALVFGTMWLFFSLREALWISATLPVSFLGSLFVMQMTGISINMVTLIGLLMTVGLIMDDSIVIAENIDKWRQRCGPVEAAARGTMEVFPGVMASFLTTVCVFGPLMFISGQLGQILRFIPLVLLITLAISLVEAFLILPYHLSHSGAADPTDHDNRSASRYLAAVRDTLVLPVTSRLLRFRYTALGGTIAFFILAIGLVASGTVRVIGFGSEEGNSMEARIALTSGIARERTEATVAQILTALDAVDAKFTPGTNGQVPLIERVLVQYGVNGNVNDNGSHTATITVDILDVAERNVLLAEILDVWRAETGPIPDLVQSAFSSGDDGPDGMAIDVELQGRDLVALEAAATDLMLQLSQRKDVTQAYQDFYGGRKELHISLNTFGYAAGLTPQSLATQLRYAFQGAETDSFRQGASSLTTRVQLDDQVSDLTGVENFPVTLPDGKQLALSSVADLKLETGYPTITRRDGMALARVLGNIDEVATTATAISAVITGELAPKLQRRYPGVDIAIGGETEEMTQSQASVVQFLLTGLIGVYLVLAYQFRSYVLPLVIMIAIPFALIGAILGHWVMGIDISMPSLIGFASLAGIVVNNSILFLTFFQIHITNDDYAEAAMHAVRERFRPVVLSTMTTFVGLLPIIFDRSPEIDTLVPLVISVAFGLLASMILILLVFPAVLTIYFDLASVRKWLDRFTNPETSSYAA